MKSVNVNGAFNTDIQLAFNNIDIANFYKSYELRAALHNTIEAACCIDRNVVGFFLFKINEKHK